MNVLVTGANGKLGTALRQVSRSSDDRWLFTDIVSVRGLDTLYLDVTNTDALRLTVESEKIQVVVNCADDPSLPDLLRGTVPSELARIAAAAGMVLFHFSWADVFGDNLSIPQQESFPAHPSSPEGAAALQGEKAILSSGCKAFIFRTQWLYGLLGGSVVTPFLRGCGKKVPSDVLGTPTSAPELAALVGNIIRRRQWDKAGLYHYSGEGAASLYDVACAIREAGDGGAFPRPCRAQGGPSCTLLDKSKVCKSFGISIPHWYTSLKNCMLEWNHSLKK